MASASYFGTFLLLIGIAACPAAVSGQLPPAGDPPYIPTPEDLVDRMLRMGSLDSTDVVYDLGSGDGRLVLTAAARGARGVGIEYDPSLVELSWSLADSLGLRDRVDFRAQDLFATDLSPASLVTLYLSAEFNLRLRPTLLSQLRPGSRVVSHAFHMGEWEPDSVVTLGTGVERATLFSWTIPARVDGFWSMEIDGARVVSLELRQHFQEVEGSVTRAARSVPLRGGRVEGREVRFEVVEMVDGEPRPLRFSGMLQDERLAGTVRGPPGWGVRRWTARRFSEAARPTPR